VISKREVLLNLHESCIAGTQEKAVVVFKTVFICHLTNTVVRKIEAGSKVYTNSRILKHLYDKKTAEEYHFLLGNVHKVIKYPDRIYKNKNPKRGDFCFFKKVKGYNYLCSLEIVDGDLMIVTAFRVRKESYLNNYELLWSWRGDIPSS